MKKIALFLSIVVAAIACDKVEPITPPEVDFANPDVVIPFAGCDEESPVTIEFKANVDWTAELIADETADGEPWISISPKSGKAGEAVINIVATENELEATRAAQVKVTVGVSVLNFDIVQEGIPYLTTEPETVSLPAAGGSATVKVDANVEYIVKTTPVEWLTADFNEETGEYTLTAVANTAYAPRSVTFTLSNELKGVSYSFVVKQEGKATDLWVKKMSSDYQFTTSTTSVRLAKYGDLILLSTSDKVLALDPETGEVNQTVNLPVGVVANSLCVDEGGNILIAADAGYNSEMYIYTLKSLDSEPKMLINYHTGNFYCTATGNVRVKGNIDTEAVVTAIITAEGGWVAWEAKNGAVEKDENNWSIFTAKYLSSELPKKPGQPNWGCVAPAGSKLSDGLWFAGYDDEYKLHYCSDPANNTWKSISQLAGAWDTNPNSISTASWNSKDYLAVLLGCHAASADTKVHLFDVTNKDEVKDLYTFSGTYLVTRAEDWTNLDWIAGGQYSDVLLVSTNDALRIYYADLNCGIAGCVSIK